MRYAHVSLDVIHRYYSVLSLLRMLLGGMRVTDFTTVERIANNTVWNFSSPRRTMSQFGLSLIGAMGNEMGNVRRHVFNTPSGFLMLGGALVTSKPITWRQNTANSGHVSSRIGLIGFYHYRKALGLFLT